MKIKNKKVNVMGLEYNGFNDMMCKKELEVIVTNDDIGKSISINNGKIQFTIPFECVEKYLK